MPENTVRAKIISILTKDGEQVIANARPEEFAAVREMLPPPKETESLIIFPPLALGFNIPPLGPAILKAAAHAKGLSCEFLDFNLLWVHEKYRKLNLSKKLFGSNHHLVRRKLRHEYLTEIIGSSLGLLDALSSPALLPASFGDLPEEAKKDFRDEDDYELMRQLWTRPFDEVRGSNFRTFQRSLWPLHMPSNVFDGLVSGLMTRSDLLAWAIEQLLAFRMPRVVGFSMMYPQQVLWTILLRRACMLLYGANQYVLGGGVLPTLLADEIAELADDLRGVYDTPLMFYTGFCEERWPEIIEAARKGQLPGSRNLLVRGMKNTGRKCVIAKGELAQLPCPEFDYLEERNNLANLEIPVQLSRGCTVARCRYCTFPLLYDGYEEAMPSAVIEQAVSLASKFGATIFVIDSTLSPSRATQIGNAIRGRAKWRCYVKAHKGFASKRMMALARNGCARMEIGLETISPAAQKAIDKIQDPKTVFSMARAAKQAGICLDINYIRGLPGESLRDADRNIASLREKLRRIMGGKFKIAVNYLELHKGTEFGDNPGKYGFRVLERYPWTTQLRFKRKRDSQ